MPTLQVRMAPTLHEAFAKHCEGRGMKMPDVVRNLIERAVDHMDDQEHEGVRPAARVTGGRIQSGEGPKPIGFAIDGTPIYAKTGPLPKGVKKQA